MHMDYSNARGANSEQVRHQPERDTAREAPKPAAPSEDEVKRIADEAERQARPENSPV